MFRYVARVIGTRDRQSNAVVKHTEDMIQERLKARKGKEEVPVRGFLFRHLVIPDG